MPAALKKMRARLAGQLQFTSQSTERHNFEVIENTE